jgi:hypothetical protein
MIKIYSNQNNPFMIHSLCVTTYQLLYSARAVGCGAKEQNLSQWKECLAVHVASTSIMSFKIDIRRLSRALNKHSPYVQTVFLH